MAQVGRWRRWIYVGGTVCMLAGGVGGYASMVGGCVLVVGSVGRWVVQVGL